MFDAIVVVLLSHTDMQSCVVDYALSPIFLSQLNFYF